MTTCMLTFHIVSFQPKYRLITNFQPSPFTINLTGIDRRLAFLLVKDAVEGNKESGIKQFYK